MFLLKVKLIQVECVEQVEMLLLVQLLKIEIQELMNQLHILKIYVKDFKLIKRKHDQQYIQNCTLTLIFNIYKNYR